MGLNKNVLADFEDRWDYIQGLDHWMERRYCTAWRNPVTPWIGSSNIVLPLIDKKIDELKPQYVNMIAAAKPPITATAVLPDFQKKSANVELWYEWLIHHGSPNFIEEITLAVDDCLEKGRGILKSYWHYETRQSPAYLVSSRLPERLRSLIVVPGSPQDANTLFARAGAAGGAIVLTKREFDRMRDMIEKVVQKEFDLDPDEPRDKKAISEVMAWFRSGAKEPLKFEHRDVIQSIPAIVAIDPLDYVCPKNSTNDPEQHERILEVMQFTEAQLRQHAIDQKLDKKAVDYLLQKRKDERSRGNASGITNSQRALLDLTQSNREGLAGESKNETYEVWKVCTRYSPTENGPEKKVVALIPAECPEYPLKFKAHSRPSGRWGYETFTFEFNKRRWYAARGIPQKIDDMDAEVTAQHRAKLNRMAIANSPTMKFKPGRHINPSVWKFFPGQMMPTPDPVGDVVPLVFPNLDMSYDNEVQMLQVYIESYLGGTDYGLTGNSTLTEPRTATEIQAIQGQARQSLSMRGLIFKLALNRLFRELLDLEISLGPKERYIQVTGGDEPFLLTKEELQGQFLINCTATIGSSDPVMEAQKAQNSIILLAQMKPLVEPQFEINLGAAVQDWMEKYDIRLMKRVMRERSPEEIQQIRQAQKQMLAAQQQQELAMSMAGQKPPQGKPAQKPQNGGFPQVPALASRGGRN